MILLLDTSTPVCKLTFVDGDLRHNSQWESGRELANGILKYLQEQLSARGKTWSDISGVGVFRGPGSFTGLRIGLTVMNTLADSNQIPIVGAEGENWQQEVLQRLANGENDGLVMPFYGKGANVTVPKK